MNNRIAQKIRINGFSLVELAIVIFIVGILLTAGLKLLSVRVNSAQIETTTTHQEAIKQALITYLGKHKRLPCPSTAAGGALPAPLPPCLSSGIVPYAELGLDRATVLDGWENYFTYALTPNPISILLPPKMPATLPPYTTAWTYSYHPSINIPPLTTNQSQAFWPANSTGGVTISDGVNTIANPALATGAVIALISHGKNGYGAFNVKQGTNDASAAGADEIQNINPVIAPGNLRVIKRDVTDSAAAGGAFDDLVLGLSASELITPLVINGSIKENTTSSIVKANDYIVGTIISTKSCTSPCDPSLPQYGYSIPDPDSIPIGLFDSGVNYARSIPIIDSTTPVDPANSAYTISAGDGTTNVITVGQLRGLLARASGFN